MSVQIRGVQQQTVSINVSESDLISAVLSLVESIYIPLESIESINPAGYIVQTEFDMHNHDPRSVVTDVLATEQDRYYVDFREKLLTLSHHIRKKSGI
jgi:hypothetical protein